MVKDFLDWNGRHFKCPKCGSKVRGYATNFRVNTKGLCNRCLGASRGLKVVQMPYMLAVKIKLIKF